MPNFVKKMTGQSFCRGSVSAGNIMLPVETTPDAGAEGFLMDLEFACLKCSSLDTTRMIAVPPLRTPGGGMTAPTIRSHTIFGPDVMRGASMTVRLSYHHGAVYHLNSVSNLGNSTVHGCGNLADHPDSEPYWSWAPTWHRVFHIRPRL